MDRLVTVVRYGNDLIVLPDNPCEDMDEDCLRMSRHEHRACAYGVTSHGGHPYRDQRLVGCETVCPFLAD